MFYVRKTELILAAFLLLVISNNLTASDLPDQKRFGIGIIEIMPDRGFSINGLSGGNNGLRGLSVCYLKYRDNSSKWGFEFHPLSVYSAATELVNRTHTIFNSYSGSVDAIKETNERIETKYYLTSLAKYYVLQDNFVSLCILGGLSWQHNEDSTLETYYASDGFILEENDKGIAETRDSISPLLGLSLEFFGNKKYQLSISGKYYLGTKFRGQETSEFGVALGLSKKW